MKVVLLSSAFPNDFYLSQWCQRIKSRAFSQELVPIQHLAVKLAHYASELDNACSAVPPGGIKHAVECRRPNREAAWVNISASRCRERISSIACLISVIRSSHNGDCASSESSACCYVTKPLFLLQATYTSIRGRLSLVTNL